MIKTKLKFVGILFLFFVHQLQAQNISIIDIKVDSNFSFRGLSVVNDTVAWLGGANGKIGRTIDGGKTWKFNTVNAFENADFRTIYAFSESSAIIANAGSPAVILRTVDGGKKWIQVYKNDNEKAFFDGIDFWNRNDGIIYGDPIGGKMLMLTTKDAGFTWKEDKNSPEIAEGEASFAASGTGIRCIGGSFVLIATGGKYSGLITDGKNAQLWDFIKTPILQGEDSQGIFSIACLNAKNIIIVGGDYLKETQTEKHVYYTKDGGKKWLFPKNPTGGYRECVEFINSKCAIAVGPSGSDITLDGGKNWKPILNSKKFHVLRKARDGNLIIAAGNGRVSIIQLKQ